MISKQKSSQFITNSLSAAGQVFVLVLPSQHLVHPAADDDFATYLSIPYLRKYIKLPVLLFTFLIFKDSFSE